MPRPRPAVVVLAGPNGAGKSTVAPFLLQGTLGVEEYVNADVIARGLSGFAPDGVALAAGRIMLTRLRELARRRRSFAFETTLASRTFAPWIRKLVASGYEFHLVFLWLSGASLAVARVSDRVKQGGHGVPEETVRRRYVAGLRNLFRLYLPLASTLRLYDNSGAPPPRLIVTGDDSGMTVAPMNALWERIRREHGGQETTS